VYDPEEEFTRQGALLRKTSTSSNPHQMWFVIDNSNFKLSPTYPSKFLVPAALGKVCAVVVVVVVVVLLWSFCIAE
jgi:hypothetical protein